MNYRPLRVSKLIREELSIMILKELEFPGAFVTVTDVTVDKKLEHAVARISVIPAERSDGVLKKIGKAQGELQHLLMKKIRIKPMPKLRFEIDYGQENAARVEKALLKQ